MISSEKSKILIGGGLSNEKENVKVLRSIELLDSDQTCQVTDLPQPLTSATGGYVNEIGVLVCGGIKRKDIFSNECYHLDEVNNTRFAKIDMKIPRAEASSLIIDKNSLWITG